MASKAITFIGNTLSPVNGDRQSPVRGLPSTAAIAGHPIHPMVIPYPVAFLTSAVASDIAARRTGDPFWTRASKLLLGAGIVGGVGAAVSGITDYLTIKRAREKATGKLHAYGNPVALALAGASLAMRRGKDAKPGTVATVLAGLTAGLVFVTGWAGAELSYRHMVGVVGHDDQHDHAEKQTVS